MVNKDSPWRQRSEIHAIAEFSPELELEMERLDKEFWIPGQKLKEIVKRFIEELDEGLQENNKNIPMNISWVHSLPTGNEKGTYLTLDLGGTNLRVCKVTLHGNETDPATPEKKYTLDQEQYRVPQELKSGSAEQLWTYIAEKLQTFLQEKGLDKEYSKDKPMPLGFTFSYPATQDKIDHAVLQTWTKGFDIKGVEGQDAAAQLREKIKEKGLPLEIVCVINDTVGAMIASAYNDHATIVGAIFGTGCNAAYMASLPSIKKLSSSDPRLRPQDPNANTNKNGEGEKMAINCEYGAFDNARRVLPITKYDEEIDKESPRPGEQAFEKLSAGLYLGEVFRLVFIDLADRGFLFANQDTKGLRKPYILDTGFLSQIEDDESPNAINTRNLFRDTLDLSLSDQEVEVSRRVAELVAFKKRWARALGEVLEWGERKEGEDPIIITSAEDGSGVGCAIIAAIEMERRGR
ncbi:hexokinase [Massarina eburnea CBS 473.64]|uniref:Phosphotransferase n=1 Tax=Massarina eburnea CBS 473.64 TaxID=1395130 RepID=A0A6A6S2J5_9PLEO|nr:hexokinase [Massarina eburnea CBS 473.64]